MSLAENATHPPLSLSTADVLASLQLALEQDVIKEIHECLEANNLTFKRSAALIASPAITFHRLPPPPPNLALAHHFTFFFVPYLHWMSSNWLYAEVHGGLAGTGPFTPTPPPLPPSRNLVRKCRTMGAKGALRNICLI